MKQDNMYNRNLILNRKKIVFIQTLNSLIKNKNYVLHEDYSLFFLNNFSILEGFDYKLLLKKISDNKNIIEIRIFFIIFESINKGYYLNVDYITSQYNSLYGKKLYKFLIKSRETLFKNVFSLYLDTNKNFKSDLETYIEYVLPDDNIIETTNNHLSNDILIEHFFVKSFFDDFNIVLNKEKFIKNFINKHNINKNDSLLLDEKYDIYFNKLKIISSSLNVLPIKKEEPKMNSSISNEVAIETIEVKEIVQKEYNNIIIPFYPPKIDRKEYYTIHDQIAYYNIDKFDENIKKEIYDIIPNASNYSLPYNKNKILLQSLAKNEIYNYAKDSIDELISFGINFEDFVFLRIYDIHKNWSNFKTSFSTDYKDFLESQAIKEKDYFEIILEYKKGTATREYLDLFLKEQKYKYFDLLHEDEFEAIVNDALYNWERNKEDIPFSIPNTLDFFNDVPFAPVFNEKDIEKFIPEYDWVKYRITFDLDKDKIIFDNINTLKEFYQIFLKTNLQDSYELLKRLKEETFNDELKLFWFIIFKRFEKSLSNIDIHNESFYSEFIKCVRTRIGEINEFFKSTFNSSSKIERFVYEQEKWIFEFNKRILESKKKAIENSLKEYCKNS